MRSSCAVRKGGNCCPMQQAFPALNLLREPFTFHYPSRMHRIARSSVLVTLLTAAALSSQTPDPHSIPAVDGAIGTCSADFTINDADNKPVYNAKVKVHIAYGFASARKLDLEVSTNVDGKARFTGLPERVKKGLFFQADEGDRTGNAFDDPSNTCKAQFTITLQKKT